ncbi:MAG: RHS repeat-associated core domain-containing protein, partial [Terriglobia bacterium]
MAFDVTLSEESGTRTVLAHKPDDPEDPENRRGETPAKTVKGTNGTYLFELVAQPGGPEGRPLTTAGSKPIRILGRPQGVRPRSPRLVRRFSHLVPSPVSTSRTHNGPAAPPAGQAEAPRSAAKICFYHARYDAFGNLAAEYTTSTAMPAAQGTQYLVADQVGSTRLVTGSSFERHDYTPYGLEPPVSGTWRAGVTGYGADSFVRWRFTGQEKDSSSGFYTGLYHFPARYMSPDQGRFWSVDPGNAGANGMDPQSWNGYSYVENMPL